MWPETGAKAAAQIDRDKVLARAILRRTVAVTAIWRQALGLDFNHMIAWLCVLLANTEYIIGQPELAERFLTTTPPDDLRRPISISNLGRSLGVDPETMRRRVNRIIEAGLCAVVADGLIVPMSVHNQPRILAAATQSCQHLLLLWRRLYSADLLDVFPPGVDFDSSEYFNNNISVLDIQYNFKVATDIIRNIFDNYVTMTVFAVILTENTRNMDRNLGGYSHAVTICDTGEPHRREPVSIRTIAAQVGFPRETVRRHVEWLVVRHLIEKRADGYLAPERVLDSPAFLELTENIRAWFVSMINRIHRMQPAT